MKKVVIIQFLQEWILAHRTDEELPIERVRAACRQTFGMKIECSASDADTVRLVVSEESSCEALEQNVYRMVCGALHLDAPDGVFSVTVSPCKEETAGTFPVLCEADTQKSSGEHTRIPEQRKADREAETLIAADEFKTLLDELRRIAPAMDKHGTRQVFLSQRYLFAINDGHGLSTYLQVFSRFVRAYGLMEESENFHTYEEKLPYTTGVTETTMQKVVAAVSEKVGICCIDISEWISHLDDAVFRSFLMRIENLPKKQIIIFRVPFVELDVLERIRSALNDQMFIRPVVFWPMNEYDLVVGAKRFLRKFGYRAQKEVWPLFRQRIAEEKSDGRFYGMDTVRKIAHEMIYKKQLSDARSEKDTTLIAAQDIRDMVRDAEEDRDPLAELDSMIGMQQVKDAVHEILSQIELHRQNSSLGAPCLNMRFVGSPGTGKTTVARLIGRILKQEKVLRNGMFFEYSGRDFCGRYIGETAPKTAGMCRDAYGSVLFIDEAYSLYKDGEDSKDYGREALDTLISEMENHRDDLLVIMAGYPDEMKTLMKGNAGLESRMPYIVEFPNFTRDELCRIFLKMAGDRIPYEEDLADAARAYFDSLDDKTISDSSFSNARFVRNLFERTCAKAAVRHKMEGTGQLILTAEDFRLASSERSFKMLQEKKKKIGF